MAFSRMSLLVPVLRFSRFLASLQRKGLGSSFWRARLSISWQIFLFCRFWLGSRWRSQSEAGFVPIVLAFNPGSNSLRFDLVEVQKNQKRASQRQKQFGSRSGPLRPQYHRNPWCNEYAEPRRINEIANQSLYEPEGREFDFSPGTRAISFSHFASWIRAAFFHEAPANRGRRNRFAPISTIVPHTTTSPKRWVGGKFEKAKIAKPAAMMISE
jgi:hypothetical protein